MKIDVFPDRVNWRETPIQVHCKQYLENKPPTLKTDIWHWKINIEIRWTVLSCFPLFPIGYKLLLIQTKIFILEAKSQRMSLMGYSNFFSKLLLHGILLIQGISLQINAAALSDDASERKWNTG